MITVNTRLNMGLLWLSFHKQNRLNPGLHYTTSTSRGKYYRLLQGTAESAFGILLWNTSSSKWMLRNYQESFRELLGLPEWFSTTFSYWESWAWTMGRSSESLLLLVLEDDDKLFSEETMQQGEMATNWLERFSRGIRESILQRRR